MKSFLSIDIDFWNSRDCYEETTADKVFNYLDRLCSKLKKRRVPMTAVMNHQQMLRLVNDSKARRLINVDQHSDLADQEVAILNCGTWVSYVRWRRQGGHYLWLHRHPADHGDCNPEYPIFEDGITRKSLSDWGLICHRQVNNPPTFNWLEDKSIVDFSLVLSPAFCERDLEPVFREIVKLHNLPYLKGTRNEHSQARMDVRPPFRKIERFPHDHAAY